MRENLFHISETSSAYNLSFDSFYGGLPVGTYYYTHDHLGSGSLITDDSGNEYLRIVYDEYGNIDQHRSGKFDPNTNTISDAAADAGKLLLAVKFTGQEYDPETGLYYYNARYYDPALGLFTTPDIYVDGADTTAGYNRYSYVQGNPVKYSDPTGHFIKNVFNKIGNWVEDNWKAVAAVAVNPVAAINGGTAAVSAANVYSYAETGNWLNANQNSQVFGAGAILGASGAVATALLGYGFLGSGIYAAGAKGSFIGGVLGGTDGKIITDTTGVLNGKYLWNWEGAVVGSSIGALSSGFGHYISSLKPIRIDSITRAANKLLNSITGGASGGALSGALNSTYTNSKCGCINKDDLWKSIIRDSYSSALSGSFSTGGIGGMLVESPVAALYTTIGFSTVYAASYGDFRGALKLSAHLAPAAVLTSVGVVGITGGVILEFVKPGFISKSILYSGYGIYWGASGYGVYRGYEFINN